MTITTQASGVKLTLTLTCGETYTWTGRKLPKHWKSALMQQVPYGHTHDAGHQADYRGATWKRERI